MNMNSALQLFACIALSFFVSVSCKFLWNPELKSAMLNLNCDIKNLTENYERLPTGRRKRETNGQPTENTPLWLQEICRHKECSGNSFRIVSCSDTSVCCFSTCRFMCKRLPGMILFFHFYLNNHFLNFSILTFIWRPDGQGSTQ